MYSDYLLKESKSSVREGVSNMKRKKHINNISEK